MCGEMTVISRAYKVIVMPSRPWRFAGTRAAQCIWWYKPSMWLAAHRQHRRRRRAGPVVVTLLYGGFLSCILVSRQYMTHLLLAFTTRYGHVAMYAIRIERRRHVFAWLIGMLIIYLLCRW